MRAVLTRQFSVLLAVSSDPAGTTVYSNYI